MQDTHLIVNALEASPLDEPAPGAYVWNVLGGPQAEAAARALGWPGPGTEIGRASPRSQPHGVVAVVSSPAWPLALAAQTGTDPATARAGWSESAKAVLAHLAQAPTHCLVLAAEEVLAFPGTARARVAAACGPTIAPPNVAPVSPDEPDGLLLARLAVDRDPLLRTLWDELSAACIPLSPQSIDLAPLPTFEAVARMLGDRAASRQALRTAQTELERQTQRLRALEQSHELLQDDHELTHLQWLQAREELDQMADRLEKARTDQRSSKERTTIAETSAQRASDQLTAALAGLDALVPAAPDPAGHTLQVGAIDLLSAREEAPHRELVFTFHDWICPTGALDEVHVRLIEHQGHPGLVLFQADDGRAPLTQWQPNGDENGRPFMILLPHEQQPDAPLMRMATADWRLVHSIATVLARELRTLGDDGHLHPHWRDIAARLKAALESFPARLRYAGLRTQPSEQGLDIRFDDVVHGTRSWAVLQLEWRRARGADGHAMLTWRLPEGEVVAPLASWPSREDGSYETICDLPFGPGANPATARSWLAGLSVLDRELLLSVFDALPAAAAQPGVPAQVGDDIRTLQREARKAVSGMHVRRIARRLLGRITGRRP